MHADSLINRVVAAVVVGGVGGVGDVWAVMWYVAGLGVC
jgi:hypothetical protein